jgi:hypothetical protein
MVRKLVPIEPEHYEFVRILRTCSENQSGFIEQVQITPIQQQEYMKKFSSFYYVCEVDGDPVGFVGSIDGDIRVAVDPKRKKEGHAKYMIEEIMKIFPESTAKVKIENKASLALFESSGFEPKYVILHKIKKNDGSSKKTNT